MEQTSALKTCPFCQEPIRQEAVKCRYCGEWMEKPRESNVPAGEIASTPPPEPLPKASGSDEKVASPSTNSKFEKWNITKNEKLKIIVYTISLAILALIMEQGHRTAAVVGGELGVLVYGACWYWRVKRKENHSRGAYLSHKHTRESVSERSEHRNNKTFFPREQTSSTKQNEAMSSGHSERSDTISHVGGTCSQDAGNSPSILPTPVASKKNVVEQEQLLWPFSRSKQPPDEFWKWIVLLFLAALAALAVLGAFYEGS